MAEAIMFRRLGPSDLDILLSVRDGLFDNPIDAPQAEAFLSDPLHELILAFDGPEAVGMASGTVLLHPDKPPALFINERRLEAAGDRCRADAAPDRGRPRTGMQGGLARHRTRQRGGAWAVPQPRRG